MRSNDRDNLIALRELLASPEHWTQGAYATQEPARLQVGSDLPNPVPLDHGKCFCILGGWLVVTRRYHSSEELHLDDLLSRCLISRGFASSVAYNDVPGRKHSEILDLLDCALAQE
jgi:hypothetical protein